MVEDVLFFEIATVIVTAGVISLVARFIKQPLIIAYILTGLIVGPSMLGLAESAEVFQALSEIGIAFLLFLVGLHLNWRSIKDVGGVSLIAGLGQVLFTGIIGYFITREFGFDAQTSAIAGAAFAFSSTIIIVKLLSDKEDISRFYGRISVGILIVQDLVAMVLLLMVAAFSSDHASLGTLLGIAVVKLIAVILVLWLLAHFVLPRVMKFAAHSQELLFLTAVGWCFALASVLTFIGFSIETGALLAGIALAGSQFQREVETKVRPLRDFFLIIFFIVLGTQLTVDAIAVALVPGLLISAFVLIGNPLIVLILLRVFGYHPRTGFLVGVTMAQVSEFSFILVAAAAGAGLLQPGILPVVTIVAIVTITVSTYLINFNEQIYDKISWMFAWMATVPDQKDKRPCDAVSVVLFGYDNMGKAILPTVRRMKESFLVVDLNPSVIEELEGANLPHAYGDMSSVDFLSDIKAQKANLVISTIPDVPATMDLLMFMKQKRSRAAVVATAKNTHDAAELYRAGASFVIIPSSFGGEWFAQLLDQKKLKKSAWTPIAKRHQKAINT